MSRKVAFYAGAVMSCVVAAWLVVSHPLIATAVAAAGLAALLAPAFKWTRFQIERRQSPPPALELVALPILLEAELFIGTLPTAAALGAAILYTCVTSTRTGRVPKQLLVVIAVLFGLSLLRPLPGTSLVASSLVPALSLAVLVISAQRRDFHRSVTSLMDGVGLYLVANVVGYYAGLVSPVASARTGGLEAADGGMRILFPLTGSLATPPVMAAVFIAAAVLCFERASLLRTGFRVIALGSAVFILLGADTRVSLIVAVGIFVLSMTSTRLLARATTTITAVAAAFAFVLGWLEALVAAAISTAVSMIPTLSRGDLANDLTLNSRSLIWERSLTYWSDNATLVDAVIGYGSRGQERSGASGQYAQLIGGVSSTPISASVHNSFLQQLFDAGLVGLTLLVGLLLWGSRRYVSLLRAGTPGAQFALPAFLAAVATGITEVTLAPGYADAPALVAVGLLLFAGTTRSASDQSEVRVERRVAQRPSRY